MAIAREFESRLADLFPFLRERNETFVSQFWETAIFSKLSQGQYICHEGNACNHLSLVIAGTARVFKLGESGREITLYRIDAGQSCILTASCILSNLPFPAFAICETDIEAVSIPASQVKQWLAESSIWRDYVFGLVARRLSNIISVVEEVVFSRMDKRIADHLNRLSREFGPVLHQTHQEIASDLGTSREVVSRILKDFESRDLLRLSRGTIELLDTRGLAGEFRED